MVNSYTAYPSRFDKIINNILTKTRDFLFSSKRFALAQVKKDGRLFRFAKKFLDDKDIILATVKNYGRALKYIPFEMQEEHPEIVEEALKNNGLSLYYASPKFKNDIEYVEIAVKQNGNALKHSPEFQDNYDIAMLAVTSTGEALRFVSDNLKNNQEIVMTSLRSYGLALRFASEDLKRNYDVVMLAIERDGMALEFVPEEMKIKHPEFVAIAILNNPEAQKFAPTEKQEQEL